MDKRFNDADIVFPYPGTVKEMKAKDFATKDYLIQLLGYLGRNVKGLTLSNGELFSLCVVGIVELKTQLLNKDNYTRRLNKQIKNLSQLDAFKDVLKSNEDKK